MPPAVYRDVEMCNESRVSCMIELCMVALPQIRCQLHDHAKQYDNDGACRNKRNRGKFNGNISRYGYGNGGEVRVRIIHGLNNSHKELTYLLQKSTSHQKPSTTRMVLGG